MEDGTNGTHNIAIFKEFSRIANNIGQEEFFELMPKGKFKRIAWPLFHESLKQQIFNKLTNEWNQMWEDEQLSEKMAILDDLREKYRDSPESAWRPKLGDVHQQTIARDVKHLENERRAILEKLEATEKRVEDLKAQVLKKRNFLEHFMEDLGKCQAKQNKLHQKVCEKIENHMKNT